MGRTCSVCASPRREEIDHALVSGQESNRRIAAQFGTTESTIRRHRPHIPPSLLKAADVAEVARSDQLLATMQSLMDEARQTIIEARAAGDQRVRLQAVKTAADVGKTLLQVAGELQDGQTVQIAIIENPAVQGLIARITGALAPYPEARDAVLDAIDSIGTGGILSGGLI